MVMYILQPYSNYITTYTTYTIYTTLLKNLRTSVGRRLLTCVSPTNMYTLLYISIYYDTIYTISTTIPYILDILHHYDNYLHDLIVHTLVKYIPANIRGAAALDLRQSNLRAADRQH